MKGNDPKCPLFSIARRRLLKRSSALGVDCGDIWIFSESRLLLWGPMPRPDMDLAESFEKVQVRREGLPTSPAPAP